ncbi:Uncharacterised protein [Mycobacteroides abscessus subsp. abscessus]|nr:Uncharacterised protein [Mycobacteroides abscessus subsp. abscessus]
MSNCFSTVSRPWSVSVTSLTRRSPGSSRRSTSPACTSRSTVRPAVAIERSTHSAISWTGIGASCIDTTKRARNCVNVSSDAARVSMASAVPRQESRSRKLLSASHAASFWS